MAPVPTGPGYDFDEFIRRLRAAGVIVEVPAPLMDPETNQPLHVAFARHGDREAVLTYAAADDNVTFTVLRSFCSELGLDAKDFGADLDWLNQSDDTGDGPDEDRDPWGLGLPDSFSP